MQKRQEVFLMEFKEFKKIFVEIAVACQYQPTTGIFDDPKENTKALLKSYYDLFKNENIIDLQNAKSDIKTFNNFPGKMVPPRFWIDAVNKEKSLRIRKQNENDYNKKEEKRKLIEEREGIASQSDVREIINKTFKKI